MEHVTILGISAFYHDSAAALVRDGRIVAAAQEERFTRRKHDERFPSAAVEYCLKEGGVRVEDLSYVVFYEKPLLKFERLLETYLAFAPKGFNSFRRAIPLWLSEKLHLPRLLDRGLHGQYKGRYVFTDHHESHAASAFFPSPFDEAAILTIDGVGEWATATIGIGRGNHISILQELEFPHSLGLLYSAFTYYTGFQVNSGEYKVMGLAPYGKPRFKDLILQHLIDLKDDGSFRMDMQYFNYCEGLTMTSEKFHRLFGGPPRSPESKLTDRDMDLAASVQAVTEEIVVRMARHVRKTTGLRHLCLAGGVALNCVANGIVQRLRVFDDVWIQPAAGDAGGALGAALFVWHQLLENPRATGTIDSQSGSLLGPRFTDDEIAAAVARKGLTSHRLDEPSLMARVSALLAEEKVVGWFRGRMEFGPRALGGRSIIGDARSGKMQTVMNVKIKFRESFRPFAPSVLRERADQYFDFDHGAESPYMLFVAPVREDKRIAEPTNGLWGLELLKKRRSVIPAVTHVDYSARLQTVDAARNPGYYHLIKRFEQDTGCPVIINTSFNVRGEPIVCTPEDAISCFLHTDIDALALENHLLLKEEVPPGLVVNREKYLEQFKLD
jgi:carbamoyltransferase